MFQMCSIIGETCLALRVYDEDVKLDDPALKQCPRGLRTAISV